MFSLSLKLRGPDRVHFTCTLQEPSPSDYVLYVVVFLVFLLWASLFQYIYGWMDSSL